MTWICLYFLALVFHGVHQHKATKAILHHQLRYMQYAETQCQASTYVPRCNNIVSAEFCKLQWYFSQKERSLSVMDCLCWEGTLTWSKFSQMMPLLGDAFLTSAISPGLPVRLSASFRAATKSLGAGAALAWICSRIRGWRSRIFVISCALYLQSILILGQSSTTPLYTILIKHSRMLLWHCKA